MFWSKDKPNKEGWYWIKDNLNIINGKSFPRMSHIGCTPRDGNCYFTNGDGDFVSVNDTGERYSWCGPIEEPVEPLPKASPKEIKHEETWCNDCHIEYDCHKSDGGHYRCTCGSDWENNKCQRNIK